MEGNMNYEEAKENAILLVLTGSHAYGTAHADSDEDERGIVIPPRQFFIGLGRFDQAEDPNGDGVIYNIQKFFNLALGANPNIWDLLWSDQVIKITSVGRKLVDNRDVFLSKRARHSFLGYAFAQMKRMGRHRAYLLGNHPEVKPDTKDFGIDPTWKIGRDEIKAIEALAGPIIDRFFDEGCLRQAWKVDYRGRVGFDRQKAIDIFIEEATRENLSAKTLMSMPNQIMQAFFAVKAYQAKLRGWKKYKEWETNRNPKRKELEERLGFDAKNAMHLLRLCRMSKEIIGEGRVIVRRPDADELLGVMRGEKTYDEIIEELKQTESQMDELYANSPLPKSPNFNDAERLLIELIKEGI
jgi:predicted nucleotidyltransferase